MPKYRVDVNRTGYGNLNIEVSAKNEREALRKAEADAGNHVFSEHTSEYAAQGVTRIKEPSEPLFKCSKCGKFSAKIGVLSYARQTLDLLSGNYTDPEVDDTIHGYCPHCGETIPVDQLEELDTDLVISEPAPNKLYLLVIESDIEPALKGPYTTDSSRIRAARRIRAKSDEDGVYRANVDASGKLWVGPFSGGEISGGH